MASVLLVAVLAMAPLCHAFSVVPVSLRRDRQYGLWDATNNQPNIDASQAESDPNMKANAGEDNDGGSLDEHASTVGSFWDNISEEDLQALRDHSDLSNMGPIPQEVLDQEEVSAEEAFDLYDQTIDDLKKGGANIETTEKHASGDPIEDALSEDSMLKIMQEVENVWSNSDTEFVGEDDVIEEEEDSE